MQLCLFNKAVSYALSKVGKPRTTLKDKQLMAIQHVYVEKTCLHGYWQTQLQGKYVHTYEFLPFVFVPCIHFGKAEAAYRHHILASYSSARCSYMLESHILLNISLCYLLSMSSAYVSQWIIRRINVVELLMHAQTVDTRCTSPTFLSAWERG